MILDLFTRSDYSTETVWENSTKCHLVSLGLRGLKTIGSEKCIILYLNNSYILLNEQNSFSYILLYKNKNHQ